MQTIISDIVPIFFVMALGYFASKRHEFSQEQAEGFNRLVLDFALPALLFASIATTSRSTLISQLDILAAATLSLLGWYFVAFFLARAVFKHDCREAGIAGLSAGAPTVGFLGIAVLQPLYGPEVAVTVAIVSLVVNVVQVPLAMVFVAPDGSRTTDALVHAIKSPIVFAPLAAVVLVMLGVDLPGLMGTSLHLIGGTTSGIAVFAAGVTLAAHRFQFNFEILFNVIGKLLILPALVLLAAVSFGITGKPLQELVLLAALPPAFSGVILASRYKTYVEEATSTLILASLAFAGTAPLWVYIAKTYTGQ